MPCTPPYQINKIQEKKKKLYFNKDKCFFKGLPRHFYLGLVLTFKFYSMLNHDIYTIKYGVQTQIT